MTVRAGQATTLGRVQHYRNAIGVYADQVELLYRMSRPAYAGTVVNAALITAALWSVAPRGLLVAWAAAVALITAARYGLYRRFLSARPEPRAIPGWCKRFMAGAFAAGCTWGALGLVLLPADALMHQFLVVFLICGMVVSALVTLTPVRAAFLLFLVPSMVPLIVTIFMQRTELHGYMGLLMLVFCGVMGAVFPVLHRMHVASLKARFENSSLVEMLSEAHRSAASANRRLTEQLDQQRITEAALQQSSSRLEALVAASPLAIIVQSESGAIKRWNPAAERIFGWSEREVLGRAVPFVPAEKVDESDDLRRRILQGEHCADIELERRRKTGERVVVSLSAAPLFDADGKANGIVLLITDISERKRLEQLHKLEHHVTRLLAESVSVSQAIPQVIEAICAQTGWAYGARWVLADEERMLCMEVWNEPTPAIEAFAAFSSAQRQVLDERKGGLLRKVWRSGAAAWIERVSADPSLNRCAVAAEAGLDSAFAFPILVAGRLYGVMEFFGVPPRPRDEGMLQIAQTIGSQIGQFIARNEAESHLTFYANHDALTGLPNRAMFTQRLTQALARAQRHEKKLAVLFVDLDRFKVINDTLGHDAGDRLLKQLSTHLSDCLRESDTVGRQGGDEFVVLIEDVDDPAHLAGVAQKILETVARPYMLSGQECHVTASVGVSIYPDDGADVQALLKNADIAMYRAKEHGKNNYQFYSAQMNLHSFERLALETGLRRALERGELILQYQPKLDMRTRLVTGAEALVRWQHPELGLVPPAQFIALAEETGLIAAIGEWVLRTACRDATRWACSAGPAVTVAVNLSARQFERDDLAAVVTGVLRESGLAPELLELEITESAVMHDADRAARALHELKQIGVRVAIDDFGTGYSSLGYLKRFPIDSVKIDRSFILDIPHDKDDVAITRAVIAMAHSLRLRVIAEGVENEEQYGFLREHDCDEMQGFHFSHPVDAAALMRLLERELPLAAPA